MFHKIMILAAAVGAVSILFNYLFNGADFDGRGMLIMGLVIVNELRALEFENMKDLLEVTRYNSLVIVDAIRKEFGAEGLRRIENRSLDILAERAPEEIREDAHKLTEAIKKLNNKEAN